MQQASCSGARVLKNFSALRSNAARRSSRNTRRNSRDSTRTGRKNLGRQEIQRWPSIETPPPGTMQCRCGWCSRFWPPGVQDRDEADLGTQVLGIGGDRAQGLSRRLEQHVVQQRLVLVGDGLDRLRHGEHDVEILDRQKIGATILQPLRARDNDWHFGQWRSRQLLNAMRWWPQASHCSTCPPSAAVRQRSMALITRSCARLRPPA